MKNTLGDLNNHLFAQLEHLGDEDLKGDALSEETNKARAVSDIATRVIANGSLVLKAKTFAYEYLPQGGNNEKKMPPMLKASLQEWDRYYYGFNHVNEMLSDIISSRTEKVLIYGRDRYIKLMEQNYLNSKNEPGFWSGCVEV